MKIRHILAAAAFMAAGVNASAAELVTNGTFDTDLSGWTVGSSGATFSNQAARLDSSADFLSITLTNLVAGTQYTFDYDYTNVAGSGTVAMWALADATSQNNVSVVPNFAGLGFTALSNTLVITFTGSGGGNKVALIDNVSLTGQIAAVPEPETYAMMLAGLGVVGFVARRRRPR